jgi:hypothetical protein
MRIRWEKFWREQRTSPPYAAKECLPADFCGSQCVHFEAIRLLIQSFLFQLKEIYVETSGSESVHAIPKSGRF